MSESKDGSGSSNGNNPRPPRPFFEAAGELRRDLVGGARRALDRLLGREKGGEGRKK